MVKTLGPGRDRGGRAWTRLGIAMGLFGLFASLASASAQTQAKLEANPNSDTNTPLPTFAKDVAPILYQKCLSCHRAGQSGPFPLETFEHARRRASDLAFVAESRTMPPWKPEPGVGPRLKHDLSLTAEEIQTIVAWAEADAPEGDSADLPTLPKFSEGWKLGPPDLILEPAEEFRIPTTGDDIYRCFVLPTNLPRDLYVSAVEYRPSNLRVVHHMTAFIDVTGHARKRDKEDKRGPGYTSFTGPGIPFFEVLGFWAAGHDPVRLPEGIGLKIPRQSDVILQIHYTPTGKPEVDRTRVGLYFSRTPVKQALHWSAAQNQEFRIPPGDSNVEIKANWFVPVDLEALAVSPHMHLLGQDIQMSVVYPSGQEMDLISIPDWDPNWQSMYQFEEPIALPAGSVLRVIAHFDNSAHPRNPNQPPKLVKWGHGAEDEMLDGFIAVVKRGQDLTQPRARDDLGDILTKQRIKHIRQKLSGSQR